MFEFRSSNAIRQLALLLSATVLSASPCLAEGTAGAKAGAKAEAPKPKATYTEAEKKIILKDMEQATNALFNQHYVHGKADKDKSKAQKMTSDCGALLKAGKSEEAVAMLTKAIAVCDSPEEKALYKTKDMLAFIKSQIYSLRGICYARLKKWPEAEKDLGESIKLCSDYSAPYIYRAKVYAAQNKAAQAGNDTAKASTLESIPSFLVKSIRTQKVDTSASDRIFNQKIREQSEASADKYYVGGAKGKDSCKMEKLYWEARKLMESEKYVPAIEKYTAAIIASADPQVKAVYKIKDMYDYKLSWNYENRSYCYLMLKNWDKAIADLSEAIKLRPNYLENYINRGKAYKALGKEKEAAADLAMAKVLKPNSLPKFLREQK